MKVRTKGVSPKLWAAVAMAVLGYLATQELVDLPPWADLMVQVGLVGGGVALAGPGEVVPEAEDIGPATRGQADPLYLIVTLVALVLLVYVVLRAF